MQVNVEKFKEGAKENQRDILKKWKKIEGIRFSYEYRIINEMLQNVILLNLQKEYQKVYKSVI